VVDDMQMDRSRTKKDAAGKRAPQWENSVSVFCTPDYTGQNSAYKSEEKMTMNISKFTKNISILRETYRSMLFNVGVTEGY
jgi:hypothetical protein